MSQVSVIIPNYQGARWLPLTLDSCLQQREFLHEIIVVDDQSGDNSWEILTDYQARYPQIVKIYKNQGKGGNIARSFGFSLSTGAFIQWLDADDQLLPGKFQVQLEAFGKYPDADVIYSDWQLDTYDGQGALVRKELKKHRQYPDFLFELLMDNWSAPNNYLLRREAAEKLDRLGGWDANTPVFQDREYFTLAAIEGLQFRYAEGNLSVYNRWSRNSVSQAKAGKGEALAKLLDKFRQRLEASDVFTPGQKQLYFNMIVTAKMMNRLSGRKLLLRDRESRVDNVFWPMIKAPTTRIKLFLALTLNKIIR